MNPDLQNTVQSMITRALSPLSTSIVSIQNSVAVLKQKADAHAFKQQLTVPLDAVTAGILRKQVTFQVTFNAPGTSGATAANYGMFFQADRAVGVASITEIHATAGTDTGAVTLQVEKLTGTTAPGSGTSLLSSAFDLKGTKNTTQYGSLTTSNPTALALGRGDRLGVVLTGTPTAVANVVVTVILTLL